MFPNIEYWESFVSVSRRIERVLSASRAGKKMQKKGEKKLWWKKKRRKKLLWETFVSVSRRMYENLLMNVCY